MYSYTVTLGLLEAAMRSPVKRVEKLQAVAMILARYCKFS